MIDLTKLEGDINSVVGIVQIVSAAEPAVIAGVKAFIGLFHSQAVTDAVTRLNQAEAAVDAVIATADAQIAKDAAG